MLTEKEKNVTGGKAETHDMKWLEEKSVFTFKTILTLFNTVDSTVTESVFLS